MRHRGTSERRKRQQAETRAFVGPYMARLVPRFPRQAPMGHGRAPVPGGGRPGAPGREVQASEALVLDGAPTVFHPTCCLARANRTRGNGTAAVGSHVEVCGMAHWGCAQHPRAPGGWAVVDQDRCRQATAAHPGRVMAGEAGRQRLGDGALPIHHPTIAQDQDQAAPPAGRWPPWDGAPRAPRALGTGPGGNGLREPGGRPAGSDRAPRRLAQRRTAVPAGLAQALAHLDGRRGRALQQVGQRLVAGSQVAVARRGPPGPAGLRGHPVGHRAGSA